MMHRYGPLFDVRAGELAKDAGRKRAAKCHESVLILARDAVRKAALSRPDRIATSDDAYLFLAGIGQDAELGNVAGSVFRGKEWVAVGWKRSERKSNHARVIQKWRLRG